MHYAAVTADRLKIRLHDCVGFFTTILLIQNIQRNNDIQRLRGSQIIQREMLQQYKNLTFSKKNPKRKNLFASHFDLFYSSVEVEVSSE